MKAKLAILTTKMWCRAQQFKDDVSGSETTEKVGMIVVAVIVIGILVGLITAENSPIKNLFSGILESAQEKLEGYMGSSHTS